MPGLSNTGEDSCFGPRRHIEAVYEDGSVYPDFCQGPGRQQDPAMEKCQPEQGHGSS